jgi:DNA-binding transcriptional MerR regulator
MKLSRDRLLTTSDAARILNISPDMVRYLERRGKLPAEYTESGQRIFRLEEVEKLARARGVGGELKPPDAA